MNSSQNSCRDSFKVPSWDFFEISPRIPSVIPPLIYLGVFRDLFRDSFRIQIFPPCFFRNASMIESFRDFHMITSGFFSPEFPSQFFFFKDSFRDLFCRSLPRFFYGFLSPFSRNSSLDSFRNVDQHFIRDFFTDSSGNSWDSCRIPISIRLGLFRDCIRNSFIDFP